MEELVVTLRDTTRMFIAQAQSPGLGGVALKD